MMDLNDCLRAVETGTSGKEHAEWLRKHLDARENMISRLAVNREDARAEAVKVALECRELARNRNNWRLMWRGVRDERNRVEAALDAMRDERDELQARLEAMIQERDDVRFAPNMALVQVQELETELEESQLYGKKTHMAWFHAQEAIEELRGELRGECVFNS